AVMKSNVEGKAPAQHHKMNLNNNACYDVVALKNILQKEAIALQEYYAVLGAELKRSYMPSEETACFDSVNILDPEKRYSFGFPYREWSAYGYQRFLLNYRERIIFPDSLFKIPENYHNY
ncbi:MAG: hypothetical protein R3240_12335, partial [Gammaproteobacteria bacterium]|nr:hypothetical protein [Gammaproteobacteria bacterium]